MSGLLALAVIGSVIHVLGAALDTALAAANRVRTRNLALAESPSGRAVRRLLADPLFELVGLPVLRAVGMLLAVSGAIGLLLWLAPAGAQLVAGVLVTALGLVLMQLLAMIWAAHDPERALLLLARPALWLLPLTRPAAEFFSAAAHLVGSDLPERTRALREDELRSLVNVDVDEEEGAIEAEEMEMIAGIFELRGTKVREVMVPRIDMVTIPIDARLDEALDTILRAGHSRIPVYCGNLDDIAGLLYAKDLLRPFRDRDFDPDISGLLREAYFVPESKPVDELLQELQRRRVHMAIVVDEYGGTAGLVTIEDLLEEIVGEIQDEYDSEEPRVERISDHESILDAGVDIDDVNRLMDIELPTDEADTLAGLVFTQLGKVPEVGEKAVFGDVEIEVLALAGRRIRRVRVRRRTGEPDEQMSPAPPGDDGVATDQAATGLASGR